MEYKEEDTVINVRIKTRQFGQAYRIKKRSNLHAAHRFNIDRVAEDVQIPDLDEIYRLGIQLKRKKNLHTLHKLRMGLSVGGESTKVFLNIEGALYAVVGCLTGAAAEMQREALNVLINLGLGTSEECAKVFRALPIYLVLHLNSSVAEIQDATAWCAGNLCFDNPEVCHEMEMLGLIGQLHVLLKSPVPRVFQSAAYALTHYYATVPEVLKSSEFAESAAFGDGSINELSVLVRKLIDGLENLREATAEAGWLLVVLSANHSACQCMLHHNIIPSVLCALQNLINQQNLDVSSATALLRVMMNCIGASPTSAIQVCNRSEKFVSICKSLLYSPHPHLRKETLQCIANVINGACQSPGGLAVVDQENLQQRLDSAVRSALAASFGPENHMINTNFDFSMQP